jgi:hypothetical protein
LYAAVAYATWGGVDALDKVLCHEPSTGWDDVQKQWLVGIDWCRSEPSALSRLAALTNSAVKVPNGEYLASQSGCHPAIPYHPKLFVLRGEEVSAVICGSGNLSRSGMMKGCECGSLFLVDHGAGAMTEGQQQLARIVEWFRDAWNNASLFDTSLRIRYEERCKELLKQGKATPTEDDAVPALPPARGRGKALSDDQIRALRTFDNLWIEAGALGANLGRGIPGNQLDMTRHTRVFFGAPVADAEPNAALGQITLIWDGYIHTDRTLKFGENGMDKLNVPPAAERGPLYYRGKTLLFTRQPDATYNFSVGDARQAAAWQRLSLRSGLSYRMPGGRRWGVF